MYVRYMHAVPEAARRGQQIHWKELYLVERYHVGVL